MVRQLELGRLRGWQEQSQQSKKQVRSSVAAPKPPQERRESTAQHEALLREVVSVRQDSATL